MMRGRQNRARDKQLEGISEKEAKRRWREDLPVSLKEMAVALELGYSTVRSYCKMPGLSFLAVAIVSASAQTVRTWTNSTNTQFNNTANWSPTGAWAEKDTLRFNGNEATQSRNFRMGYTNSSTAVSVSGSWTAAFPAGGFGRLEVARRDGCSRFAA